MEDVTRVGFVSSVNAAAGTVQVTYQDRERMVTGDMPVLTFGGEYDLPEVNDMVIVAHLSNDLSSGVVLGRFWNAERHPERSEWYKRIAADIILKKAGNILEIQAPEVRLTGAGGGITLSEIIEKLQNLEERVSSLESEGNR